MSINNPTKSLRQINQEISKNFVADVFNRTVRRLLCEAGLFECIAAKNLRYPNDSIR